MRVANYIIEFFKEKGVEDIFVVYGSANGDLIDACAEVEGVRFIQPHHEQAAGFAAEGYAKVSRNFGVAIATSGPGGHNLVTPIANCFYESIPCFFMTGQVNSKFLRKNDTVRQNGFQETDIVSITKPITKYSSQIKCSADIRYELEKAYYHMMTGRFGPVLLDVPSNIQKEKIEPDNLKPFTVEEEYACSQEALTTTVECFINDLLSAKRPTILIGAGIKLAKCEESFLKLVDTLNIPIFPTWNALDIVTNDNPLYCGRVGTYGGEGRNFGIQNSDLLLCIGTRVSGRITGGYVKSFARGAKKYLVDIDPAYLVPENHDVVFNHRLCINPEWFIFELMSQLDQQNVELPNYSKWLSKCVGWRNKYDPVKKEFYKQKGLAHPYVFARTLSEMLGNDDTIITDCGGNVVIMNHAFKTKYGQKYFSNNSNSPMGFAFASSLGAYLASKGKGQTVCVIGDGGMNMNIQELQTLNTFDLKPKVFVMNNHIYGITKAYQKTNFNGRMEACGPNGYIPPDFIKVAKAYGIKTFSIKSNSLRHIKSVIKKVIDYDGAVLCDIDCDEYHTYQPRVFGWKTPIEEMYPYLDREEAKKNMSIEVTENFYKLEYPDVE